MTEATTDTARDYYTSDDAVEFYSTVWGGEDIHVGLYDTTKDIREASRLTVDRMAQTVCEVEPGTMPIHHRMRCADAARVQGLVMAGRCEQAREAADEMGRVVIEEHEGGFSMRSRPEWTPEDEPTDVVYRWARRKADRCRSRAPSPR